MKKFQLWMGPQKIFLISDSQCQPPLLGTPGGGLLTLLQAQSPRIPGSWGVLEETTEILFARVEP